MTKRILVYGGITVAVVLVAVLALFAYQFYYNTYAETSEKALTEYFAAFSKGDYGRMYEMTRGVPGSPQTAGEFAAQVRWLVKDTPPKIASVQLESVGSKGTARYYKALLKMTTTDGSYRLVSLLAEVIQEGDVWKVSYPFAPGF